MTHHLYVVAKHVRLAIVLAVMVVSAAGVASAQRQEAEIVGQITDESGAIMPGVSVTARGASLQLGEMTSVSDSRGEYRLTRLPIGSYEVVYALDGFQSLRREGVRLTVGFTAKLDVVMKLGSLAETVVVSGAAPLVDVTTSATRTEFTREILEVSPGARNGIIALLNQAPGVRANLDVGGDTQNSPAVFHAFGQDWKSWQTLEGVATVQSKDGTGGVFWDYAAVDEAQIQTVGSGAEIPSRGVVLTGLVKSGGNAFHSTALWAQSFRSLQSSNLDDRLRRLGVTAGGRMQERWELGGDLGGRIVRDKLWFYGAIRRRRDGPGQPTGLLHENPTARI